MFATVGSQVFAASSSIGSTLESAAPIFITMNGKVKTAIAKSTAPVRKEILGDVDPERRKRGPRSPLGNRI